MLIVYRIPIHSYVTSYVASHIFQTLLLVLCRHVEKHAVAICFITLLVVFYTKSLSNAVFYLMYILYSGCF